MKLKRRIAPAAACGLDNELQEILRQPIVDDDVKLASIEPE